MTNRFSRTADENKPAFSNDFLRYLLAVLLVGSLVSFIESRSTGAAWILVTVLILGVMVAQPIVGFRINQLASRIAR